MRRIDELDHIEELVRGSLRARAEDVEPTPVLWQEVEARITRRRRRTVLSWSLAGAAAALAAVVVVPAMIGAMADPSLPEIAPVDALPPATSGTVPTHAVVVDATGATYVLELATGQLEGAGTDVAGSRVLAVVVPAGSEPDRPLYVLVRDGQTPSYVFVSQGRGATTGSGYEPASGGAWEPSLAGSQDGAHAALLQPTEQDDGAVLAVREFAAGDQPVVETTIVLEGGARLLDWVGPTGSVGDLSTLWVLRPDGTLVAQQLRRAESTFVDAGTEVLRQEYPVVDAASARIGPAAYFLEDRGGYLGLVWSPDGGASETTVLHLGEVLGLGTDDEVWLDGRQDGVLVGDGDRVWLLAHDGAGNFADPVEVGTGIVRAALLDAVPTAAPEPGVEESPAADEGPTGSDEGRAEAAPTGIPPEPVVVVDGPQLRLLTPDGEQTLVDLPSEGHSVFLAAAVRPGSTVDDLTVASLTTAEGMSDLRWTRIVDGEVVVGWEPFEGAYAPTHDGIVSRPVWSPDGTSLGWIEQEAGGPASLRVVGWSDGPGAGDTATDNAGFTLDAPAGALLLPQEWVGSVSPVDGMTEIRVVLDEPTAGWYAIPLERQPDGAWASPAGVSITGEPGPIGVAGSTAALAAGADGGVGWMVRLTDDGPILVEDPYGAAVGQPLPEELLPDEGLSAVWLRPAGDGVLVGSPNTASAWFVPVTGNPIRLGGTMADADVVR